MTPVKYQMAVYGYALLPFVYKRMGCYGCPTVLVFPFKLKMNCKQSVCRVDCS